MKHIKVTGCYDCDKKDYYRKGDEFLCTAKAVDGRCGFVVTQEVYNKTIHPSCPLENYEENTKGKYYELLYCVGTKYSGESRHDTALRYIKEREVPGTNIAQTENPQ